MMWGMLDNKLVALRLFLAELGLDGDGESFGLYQGSIYLGQVMGADLNYRYRWCIGGGNGGGIYCESLHADLDDLRWEYSKGVPSVGDRRLQPEMVKALRQLQSLLNVPAGVDLRRAQWIELLAIVDFLRRVSGKDQEEARKHAKAEPATYFDVAWGASVKLGG